MLTVRIEGLGESWQETLTLFVDWLERTKKEHPNIAVNIEVQS